MRLLAAAESAGGAGGRGDDGRRACHGGPTCTTRCSPSCSGPRPALGGRPPQAGRAGRRRSTRRSAGARQPGLPRRGAARVRPRRPRAADHPVLGAAPDRPPGGRAAAGLQGAGPAARRARLGVAAHAGCATGRFRPEYVVGGVVVGPVGHPRRRRAADPAGAARRRCAPTRAGGWWSPTPRSWSRGCWPRCPATTRWPPATTTSTPRWPPREFGGDRDKAKLALLSAMYGAAPAAPAQLLGALRRRFPAAMAYVEDAARAGEEGRLVRSHLGRTCPPARPGHEQPASGAGPRPVHPQLRRAGHRGRVGATCCSPSCAARCAPRAARPGRCSSSTTRCCCTPRPRPPSRPPPPSATRPRTAGRRLFGDSPVRFPMQVRVVEAYDER